MTCESIKDDAAFVDCLALCPVDRWEPRDMTRLLTIAVRVTHVALPTEGAPLQAAIAEVVLRARFTLLEQRSEFDRGELGDLDALEDALNAYDALVSPRGEPTLQATVICSNCGTRMPEGCGGQFRKDGHACLLNRPEPQNGSPK